MIISVDAEKTFEKILHRFMIKTTYTHTHILYTKWYIENITQHNKGHV